MHLTIIITFYKKANTGRKRISVITISHKNLFKPQVLWLTVTIEQTDATPLSKTRKYIKNRNRATSTSPPNETCACQTSQLLTRVDLHQIVQ